MPRPRTFRGLKSLLASFPRGFMENRGQPKAQKRKGEEMERVFPARELGGAFGEVLKRTLEGPVFIEEDGRRVAVVLDIETYGEMEEAYGKEFGGILEDVMHRHEEIFRELAKR